VTLSRDVLGCFAPVDGTCPPGCTDCACASPLTPIATPEGERAIAELRAGDLVYSVHRGRVVAVPLIRVRSQRVTTEHMMMELRFAGGRVLTMSPLHPTADGRTFADIRRGDLLDGVEVLARRLVPYGEPRTYDILPDSDSATYFAAGLLVGSTLAAPWAGEAASVAAPPPLSSAPRD
jgi:hypothetical protein